MMADNVVLAEGQHREKKEGACTEYLKHCLGLLLGIVLRRYDGNADHYAEMDRPQASLSDAVSDETDVKEHDAQPEEPEDTVEDGLQYGS